MNTTTTKIAGEAAMTDEQIDDIADDVVGPGTRLSYAQARAFARALLASKPAVPEGWKPELLYGPCQNVCWTQDMVPREERIDAVVISHSDYERLLVAPTAPAQSCGDAEQADEAVSETDAFEEWAQGEKYDMAQHPLHYLFLDAKTYAARQGWKAALCFAARAKDSK